MKILFIVNPLRDLHLEGDTSYALMLEAARRGHRVFSAQIGDLALEGVDAWVKACETQLNLSSSGEALANADAFTTSDSVFMPLAEFAAVFMRTDPPLNVEYLQATWILERARGKTVLVNDPRGLREHNEHLSILNFPEWIPPTIVTRDEGRLRSFLSEQGGSIILKPVDGFGGLGIFLTREGDPNLSSILETSTQGGRVWTMAQRYLPAAKLGDKRIILVDGRPIGAVLRVPPEGEARDNLHVGGKAVKTSLTLVEEKIIAAVAPTLREYGQLFVGLDVIGDTLTEINITSPTGIRQISRLDGINAAAPIFECVEKKAKSLGFSG